ncbi:hypothetical protein Efla_000643 [Eimeria flavescens]
MKLVACLFAAAAAAAAAVPGEAESGRNATLHVGVEDRTHSSTSEPLVLCLCLCACRVPLSLSLSSASSLETLSLLDSYVLLCFCLFSLRVYNAANIVRAARLNTRLGLIERSTELENDANQRLLDGSLSDGNSSCEKLQKPYEDGVRMEVPLSSSSLHALVHDVYACIGTPFVPAAASLQAAVAAAAAAESYLFLLCVHAGHQAYGGFLFYVFEGKDANCLERMVEGVNKLLTHSPKPKAAGEREPAAQEETLSPPAGGPEALPTHCPLLASSSGI